MRFIVISGMDGCGKTTVIGELRRKLEEAGLATRYQWFRHSHFLVRPLHAICRLIGLSRRYKVGDEYVWRHEFFRWRPFCFLYLIVTLVDTWLGALRLRWGLRNNDIDVVVCDRWILDTIVDLAVKFRWPNLIDSTWHDLFSKMQPAGTMQFLLDRDVQYLLQSRIENQTDPEFPFRYRAYQRSLENRDVIKVDNNGSVESTVQQLISHIASRRCSRFS